MEKKVKQMAIIGVLVVICLFVLVSVFNSIITIKEGRIGVHYRLGKLLDYPIMPGTYFSVPFIDYWDIVDMREAQYRLDTTAYTKDTQPVEHFIATVNYQYDASKIEKLVKDIGVNYVESKIVVPEFLSVSKNKIGNYKAEELIQHRQELQEAIETELRQSMSKSGLIVAAVNILDIDFEDSFEATIREKVAAEQEALKSKNKTLQIEEEAKQKVIKAQGEADAKKIEADANSYEIQKIQEQLSKSPQYNEYIKMQKWDGKLPSVMGSTVNAFSGLN